MTLTTTLSFLSRPLPVLLLLLPAVIARGEAYWRFEEAGGTTVLDSGPDGLDGTLSALPFRTPDVPVDSVPFTGLANTQSLDLNWQDVDDGGVFEVPDTAGLLSFGGNTNFTIEVWVRLDHLSDTSGPDERQYLCIKNSPAADKRTDYAVRVQRGDNSPGTTYGKTSDFSGRELQVVFGTGNAVWSVTSNLQIDDLDWHYMSVACDVGNNLVRFVLDDQVETITYGSESRTTNSGDLLVGAYQNYGVQSSYLRGSLDEMRITRRFLSQDELLSAPLIDCNDNGTADYLDIRNGTSEDCNANAVPDECDIADGTSEDCQPDGTPDECQLVPFYSLDDGETDIGVRAEGSYTAWMNQFTVENSLSTITDIELQFGDSAVGQPATLYLWADPDGDGDPTDATVLTAWPITVEPEMVDPLMPARIDIDDTFVGPTGTSFFVGVIIDEALDSNDFPAAADWDAPTTPGRSWLVGATEPIDPNNLLAYAIEFGVFEDLLPAGNWSVRAVPAGGGGDANGNGIPDECEGDDCPEDLDGDGFIGQADLGILLAAYGMDDGGDINGDGITDQADLGALLAAYGTTCP